MEAVPDEILLQVLSFLPMHAFLPIAHVSKRFRAIWLKRQPSKCSKIKQKMRGFTTNPLQIGNLFQTPWNKKPTQLTTSLLEYYVSCGWNEPKLMQRVLRETAARGDITGMGFLVDRYLCNLNDVDICTVAGAAGHLKALRWLREQKQWPWDPTEVVREASENLQVAVITYVEQNSDGYEIRSPSYGDGLPW